MHEQETNHAGEMEAMSKMPMPYSPRIMMLLIGLPIGAACGLVLGLFAVIAAIIMKKKGN